ncbi:MAG: GNAT family N-acetyltransferase [Phycisphaerae bacterium]|nr:GNAT family N-acetyltransferase [Phycisphaerae bacterium]
MHTTSTTIVPAAEFETDAIDPRANPPTVEPLTAADEPAWKQYVAHHPDGWHFHELTWQRAVRQAFGHRPVYLMARRGDDVCGVLPLFVVESRLAGRLLVSVPYAVHGGPLADDAESAAALRRAAERIARSVSAASMEWRCVRPPADAPNGAAADDSRDGWRSVDEHLTFRRALPADARQVPDWLPRKARAAARRAAERHDLTVSFDDAALPDVWRLYAISMRRLGSINYSYGFFEALIAETPGRHLVQTVRADGRPVAGLITLLGRGVAMPYFVGTVTRGAVYGLSNYLYCKAIERCVEMGCTTFDFGRSRRDNAGGVDFKRFHGFTPQPLAYERFVPAGGRDARLSPSHPRFAMPRRLWPWLPLAVTTRLGAWLARSIPG